MVRVERRGRTEAKDWVGLGGDRYWKGGGRVVVSGKEQAKTHNHTNTQTHKHTNIKHTKQTNTQISIQKKNEPNTRNKQTHQQIHTLPSTHT